MRVILDTNVLVSALLTAGGVPARLLQIVERQVPQIASSTSSPSVRPSS